MIGENTIIRGDVVIGENSKIWHNCNLYGCQIGKNTQIGSYTEIKEGAKIGDDCRFQSYVFVPEYTDIGNRVFVGPRVTFLNDKSPSAQKAIRGTWELSNVVVEDDAIIGGGVIILPGVRIGTGAFIGAGSVVTKDVEKFSTAYGNPAEVKKTLESPL
jgi:UDP-2-acetamido-3-amino-2,3-dideoxy-glucuronate N-acetyltransferase